MGAADLLGLRYSIEAQDCQVFDWGTNARAITVAFWIKATKTGTNILELFQTDASRICCQAYTIDTTNTWEFKVVNFPADTSGSANDDNGAGLELRFWMAAGTDWTSGTLATTWEGNTDANRAVGQVNNADSTSNNFAITAVQLEAAEYTSADLPPFQHESYGDNLLRCQRYFNIFGNAASKPMGMAAFYTASAAYVGPLTYPVEMRAYPTITIFGGGGGVEATAGFAINHSASNDWFQTFSSSDTSTKECQLYASAEVSATDGDAGRCKTGNIEFGKVTADAEL